MIYKLIIQLFKILQIPFTYSYLEKLCKAQPFINTFYGVVSILHQYGIKTKCFHFDSKDLIKDTNFPIILSLESEFVILVSIIDNECTILTTNGTKHIMTLDILLTKWKGNAIMIEPNKNSGEEDFQAHRLQEKLSCFTNFTLSISICIIIILYFIFIQNSISEIILIFLNVLGIFTCILLIKKNLGVYSPTANFLCNLIQNSTCSDFMHGDTRKNIHHLLTNSGISFFSINTIYLLASYNAHNNIAFISYLLAPFGLVSIIVQSLSRKWCVLCLIIVGLLWSICIYSFNIYPLNTTVSYTINHYIELFIQILSYIILFIFMNKLESHYFYKEEASYWRKEYNKLKNDRSVVLSFFKNNESSDLNYESCSTIVFGSRQAKTEITVVSNPYCVPCGLLHMKLTTLKSIFDLRIRYVYTYFTKSLANVNKLFIASYLQQGEEKCWDLMTEWYGNKNELELSNLKSMSITPDVEIEFDRQDEWVTAKNITKTPNIFINGIELRDPYDIDDLTTLLPFLK